MEVEKEEEKEVPQETKEEEVGEEEEAGEEEKEEAEKEGREGTMMMKHWLKAVVTIQEPHKVYFQC